MAPVKIRLAVLLCGGALLAAAPALAAGPIHVGIRIEGAKRTLVSHRTVTLADAPVPPKDGDPSHTCPGQSALGAIQAGTNGDWNGSWSDPFGYFVTTIRGEQPTGSAFFTLWVNHKLSSTGACQTALRKGDDVLLFVDRCVTDPTTQQCKNKPVTPLALRVRRTAVRGQEFVVRVVAYSAGGKAHAVRGAKVYANQKPLRGRTDAHGRLKVRAQHIGHVSFDAKHAGNAKSEVEKTHILKP